MVNTTPTTILHNFPTSTDYHIRGFAELLALKDCLTYRGVETDWTDILGLSGDAFGCDGMTGLTHARSTDVLSTATEAYGYRGCWGIASGTTEDADFVLAQVRETLARNLPIIACGARLSPQDGGTYCAEWTVVLGVDTDNRRLLLSHGLADLCWGTAAYRWFGRVPWATGDTVQRNPDGLPFYWQRSDGFYLAERTATTSPTTRMSTLR